MTQSTIEQNLKQIGEIIVPGTEYMQPVKKIFSRENGRLEAHDKIPVGLQSLMGNINVNSKHKGPHQLSSTQQNSFNLKYKSSQATSGSESLKMNERMKFSEPYLGKLK